MAGFFSSFTLPDYVFQNPAVSILLPVALGIAVGFSNRLWTVLYGAMGYAAHRAWTTGSNAISPSIRDLTAQGATLYTIQLGLNLMWMPLYFKYRRPIESSVDIVALTGVTMYMTYIWGKVDEVAAYTLLPYVGWLSFATYLCIGGGYLNDWNFNDKIVPAPPSTKSASTKYVDEKSQ